jgi:chromosome segregation ATPase
MPVAFEYDDRQATQQMRARLEDELRTLGATLDDSRGRLEEQVGALRSVQVEYEARAAALGRTMDAHNAEILRWNREGGAPDSVRTRLETRAEAPDAEMGDLQRQAEELQRLQQLLSRETALLNQRIEERNERANELGRAFPPTYTEAGRYSESVQTRNGQVVDVRRAIDIFRFSDRQELVLVLAHELGHALGLGHSSVAGAVMHEVTRSGVGSGITAADLALLSVRCPGVR